MKKIIALFLGTFLPATIWASSITISYDFLFDQNTFHPGETPLTGSVTVTLNTPAGSGYTTDGVVDSLEFSMPGQPGFQAADTNYVKMLFNASGQMTYLLVSDRSDFALSAIPPRKAGYILGLQATNLLTGTGISVGSFGSTFSYYFNGRTGVDVDYTFSAANIKKVANPVATVPDTPGTLGLLTLAMFGVVTLRRRLGR